MSRKAEAPNPILSPGRDRPAGRLPAAPPSRRAALDACTIGQASG